MHERFKIMGLKIAVIIFIFIFLVFTKIIYGENVLDPTINYNQSQTAVIVGSTSSSTNNLNAQDGITYDVSESPTPQTNQSSDLETGTIRNRVIGTPTLTGNKTPSNWGKNVNNWLNQSNITLSDNKWTYAFTQYNSEDWYNFGFSIPAGSVIYGIRGIVEYSANSTSATTCSVNISNNNGTSYAPMTDLSSSSTTDANTTLGTYASLWGLTWNTSNINAAGGLMIKTNKTQSQAARMFRIDTLTLEVNYSPPVTDLNTTYTTYNNVLSGNYLTVNNISVTVNVSSYNNTSSAGKSSNPDLWLEVWNGTIWSVAGNMTITGKGNDTTYVPNRDNIYLNWSGSSTQRNIRIMGRYFDANDTTYDEINWTAVWVTVNYSNFYRAEIEHNTTGISSGKITAINASINFSTNVTNQFNLTIYNFNTGSWNSSFCQNGTATANNWYNWWCNVTSNPMNYNSSNGVIRLRLNGTNHSGAALVREDYVQYYVGYPSYLEVNLTNPDSSKTLNVVQNKTFNVNSTVFCKNGPCGQVYGTVMYNLSSSNPNTPVNVTQGDKPFYIQESPANAIKSCGTMNSGDSCQLNWTINATGNANSNWKIGVLFNSSYTDITNNNTNNVTISILSCTEDFNLNWNSIKFGLLNPSTGPTKAPGNDNNLYNITVNPGSCNMNFYISGTDLTNTTLQSKIGVGNITWSNTSNSYSTSYNLSYAYNVIKLNAVNNTNVTTWYWINVPAVYAGYYIGNITITGVKSG